MITAMMLKIGVLVAGAEYPIVSVLVSNSFAEYEYVCVYIYTHSMHDMTILNQHI